MPVKPFKGWKPKKTPTPEADQVSSFVLNIYDLQHAANDTVTETRGAFAIYRPGDIWKMLQGTVFQR